MKVPLSANPKHEESWVKSFGLQHDTGPRRLAAYELMFPEFAKWTLEQRLKECNEYLHTFRAMCEATSVAQEHSGFYHFGISYPHFVEIVMNKDMKLLERCMRDGGGPMCRVAFAHFTDHAFNQYFDLNPRFLGSAEILMTLEHDVQRICFMKDTQPLFAPEQVESLVSMAIDGDESKRNEAREFLQSADVQAYLRNPQLFTCAHCKKQRTGMPACGQCKGVRYCSTLCQREDWPKHKGKCKKE